MSSIGPELPPHLLQKPDAENLSDEDQAGPSTVGPQIPPHLAADPLIPPILDEGEEESDDDDYGPALPPDLAASRTASHAGPSKRVVGPSFPPPPGQNHDRARYGSDGDSDDDFGPQPLPAGMSFEEEDGVREFMEREERRRKQVEVRIL